MRLPHLGHKNGHKAGPAHPEPDFRSPDVLRQHVLDTTAFYDGRCKDPAGGFFQFFRDDGTVYDRSTRHLVSSTRFVITHAMMARHFPTHPNAEAWRDGVRHGLKFLSDVHRDPASGGYAWLLRFDNGRREVLDGTLHCYGHAFVLLAYAHALMAGVTEARDGIKDTYALMEQRYWESQHGLYADEADASWQLRPYRGQNANMHACEAMLAAYDATGEGRYLDRAATLADSVTGRLAGLAGGLVWEHWHISNGGVWMPDWDYNKDDKTNIFRPWGVQPGHLTEWAKLLLTLERAVPDPEEPEENSAPITLAPTPQEGLVHRARHLYAAAVEHAWDRHHGGLVYGFAPDGTVCDADKYHWVQAESLAAAAVLAQRTGEGGYWDWYDRLWSYCWAHFVDHEHGAWFRILNPDNSKRTDEKSPAGKVDYHNIGACLEAIAALER